MSHRGFLGVCLLMISSCHRSSGTCSEAGSQSRPQSPSGRLVPEQTPSSSGCTETCTKPKTRSTQVKCASAPFSSGFFAVLWINTSLCECWQTYRRWTCWFRSPAWAPACCQTARCQCRRTGRWWWWCRTRPSYYRINSAVTQTHTVTLKWHTLRAVRAFWGWWWQLISVDTYWSVNHKIKRNKEGEASTKTSEVTF